MDESRNLRGPRCPECHESHNCGTVCMHASQGYELVPSTSSPQLFPGRCTKLSTAGQVPLCSQHYRQLLIHQGDGHSARQASQAPGSYFAFGPNRCHVTRCPIHRVIYVTLCDEHDRWLKDVKSTQGTQDPTANARCRARGCRNSVSLARGQNFCNTHQDRTIPEGNQDQMPFTGPNTPNEPHRRRRRATYSGVPSADPPESEPRRRHRDSFPREPQGKESHASVGTESPTRHRRRRSSGSNTRGNIGEDRSKQPTDNAKFRVAEGPHSMPPPEPAPKPFSNLNTSKTQRSPSPPPTSPSPSRETPPNSPPKNTSPNGRNTSKSGTAEKPSRHRWQSAKNEFIRSLNSPRRKTSLPKVKARTNTLTSKAPQPRSARNPVLHPNIFPGRKAAGGSDSARKQKSPVASSPGSRSIYSPPESRPETTAAAADELLTPVPSVRTSEGATGPSKSVKFVFPADSISSKTSSSNTASRRSAARRR